jgi:BA14K-like protein
MSRQIAFFCRSDCRFHQRPVWAGLASRTADADARNPNADIFDSAASARTCCNTAANPHTKPNAAPNSNVAIPDNSATENATPIAQTPSKPKCDVIACSNAYRSFQESDCTYQPSNGPRRLCTKGVVVSEPSAVPNAATTSNTDAETNPQSSMQCNVNACAAAYVSFNRSDCAYQPLEGPRRLCKK